MRWLLMFGLVAVVSACGSDNDTGTGMDGGIVQLADGGSSSDGQCEVPIDGVYRSVLTVGSNTCGTTPGFQVVEDAFFRKGDPGFEVVFEDLEARRGCKVDADFWFQDIHFVGVYTFGRRDTFEFRGTVVFPDCSAQIEIRYRKL